MSLLRRYLAALGRGREASQVELHGEYSASKLCSLYRYTRGPRGVRSWRMLAVLLLTPAPSLLLITLPEMFTLSPPFDGLELNHSFYGRMFLTFLVFCSLATQQASARLPALPLSTLQCVAIAAGIAGIIMAVNFSLATRIGFPLPFAIQLSTPTHLTLMTLAFSAIWRSRFAEVPAAMAIARPSLLFACQAFAIFVYPIYYHAFTRMPGGAGPRRLLLAASRAQGRLPEPVQPLMQPAQRQGAAHRRVQRGREQRAVRELLSPVQPVDGDDGRAHGGQRRAGGAVHQRRKRDPREARDDFGADRRTASSGSE